MNDVGAAEHWLVGVYFYHPHPKDGEGNSFSLFVSPHQGGGGTPSLSHNTSTSTSLSGGEGVPQSLVQGPFQVGTLARSGQRGLQDGVPPGRDGVPLCRDWVRGGRYASCVHAGGLSCFATVLCLRNPNTVYFFRTVTVLRRMEDLSMWILGTGWIKRALLILNNVNKVLWLNLHLSEIR